MSGNSQATGAANETNNYLPPVAITWIFKNPFEGRRERIPNAPMEGAIFSYGPFRIGKTGWMLEYRIPSDGVWLKRIGSGDENDEEELSFQFIRGGLKYKDSFMFTSANKEVLIYDAGIGLHCPEYDFTLEAFVRPDNYASGLPCDFRIVVLDKNDGEKEIAEFAAHRSILSEGSLVFKAMLDPDSKCKQAKEGVLKIRNFPPETVKSLLVYVYTKNENLVDGKSFFEAMELLDAAEKYQIKNAIKKQCCARLLELIDCRNAVQLLIVAERWMPEQKQVVMEFIHGNRREIIKPATNDKILKRLSSETLLELLKVFSQ